MKPCGWTGVKKAEGDPQRVVGSYVTDVARQEERFLVAADEKARKEAGAGELSEVPGPAVVIENVDDMNQAGEGRWGSGGVQNVGRVPGHRWPARPRVSSAPSLPA